MDGFYDPIYLLLLITTTSALMMAAMFLLVFMRRQQRRDEFDHIKWDKEMALRSELELRRSEFELKENARSAETGPGTTLYGGYVFVDMPDEYKGLFHDMLRGFEDYASAKGYRVSIAIDTTLPGRVGFRFTIVDEGVTVATTTVRSDIDEYMARLRDADADPFEDMPMVTDPVQHEKLKAVLAARYATIKHQVELNKGAARFYEHLAHNMSGLGGSGISYLSSPTIITQVGNQAPAAAGVGRSNALAIDSRAEEQLRGLQELIELVTHSSLENGEAAVRHLTNAKEELEEGRPPNTDVLSRVLGKAEQILRLAEKGTAVYKKAQEVLGAFGFIEWVSGS